MSEKIYIYNSKYTTLPGQTFSQVWKISQKIYSSLKKQTKRKPYIRSKFFKKQKIFLNYFWQHLAQKSIPDKTRRLRYFEAAIDLIKNSQNKPEVFIQKNQSIIFYRFFGKTKNSKKFCVQIKEDITTDQKNFMSVFPIKK